ncbi:MAG: hypothetical protein BWX69_03286 [Planctomycetes bacterium ADurb.Bin069]|nr:MAG: hypothetical protein BWX69_03286 [Planctomycetes bacterium ADurb.Bin069]
MRTPLHGASTQTVTPCQARVTPSRATGSPAAASRPDAPAAAATRSGYPKKSSTIIIAGSASTTKPATAGSGQRPFRHGPGASSSAANAANPLTVCGRNRRLTA